MNDQQKRITAATLIATAIAIPAEGIRQIAYYDPPGILTVCMGHTGAGIDPKKKYSLAECNQFLTQDMHQAISEVERCQPGLPAPVLAAFGDAVFNMGSTIACNQKKSTAARLLAAGRIAEACEQLPRWNKAKVAGMLVELPGLTKRRNLERSICLEGVA
jgi:lysozyme